MLILLFVYFAVMLFGVRFSRKGCADYLSIDNTQAIKGIFIIMVFFSHFNSYISLSGQWDDVYIKFFRFVGQAMVTPFLFYSGYGVMESIKRKGTGYIASMPKKRILATLFNFDCAVLLYLLLGILLGSQFTVKQIGLSLIGWDSLGNSNWYIFTVLILYLLTYFVFVIFPKKPHVVSVAILGVLVCAVVYVTMRYHIKEPHWYDTALCYVLGMGYSLVKQPVEKIVNKNVVVWAVCLAMPAALYALWCGRGTWGLLANLMFAVALVVFTMRITLHNKVLQWCGEHLFELYILQRIPMMIFKRIGLLDFNVYVGFALCAGVTVLLSIGFKFVTGAAWTKLTAKK